MASYDRYAKRIAKLKAQIKEGAPDIDLRVDDEKLKKPAKHMDYIFSMVIENKIAIELGASDVVLAELKNTGLEIE